MVSTTVNWSRRIALLFFGSIVTALLLAGAAAVIVSVERVQPGTQVLAAESEYRLLSVHGAMMIYLVLIPLIPATLGFLYLDRLSSRGTVAFPRLALASWLAHAAAVLTLVFVIVSGGFDTGWALTAPYSIESPDNVQLVILAVVLAGLSLLLLAINILVGVYRVHRQAGGRSRMSLFGWGLAVWGAMQVITAPVLLLTMILLSFERLAHIGIFDPAMGGDPLLYRHLFWFYAHPAVATTLLPALGVVAELVSSVSARDTGISRTVFYSVPAVALFSLLSWGTHFVAGGQSEFASIVFGFFSLLTVIPLSIIIASLIVQVTRINDFSELSAWYAVAVLGVLVVGLPTTVIMGALGTNPFFHNTEFVPAHFHYLAVGATILAFLGGLHHRWPHLTGRRFGVVAAKLALMLIVLGVHVSFVTLLLLGTHGVPRRMHDVLGWQGWLSSGPSIGGFCMAAGFGMILVYLSHTLLRRFEGSAATSETPGAPPAGS